MLMTFEAFHANNRHVYRHEFNETQARKDYELLQKRIAALTARSDKGARVGDFVRFPDGSIRRFSHNWEEYGIQTTPTEKAGSFYFSRDGYCDYSGSLEPSIPHDKLQLTDETRDGSIWFFSGDFARAHHGVYAFAPFRVYNYTVEQ